MTRPPLTEHGLAGKIGSKKSICLESSIIIDDIDKPFARSVFRKNCAKQENIFFHYILSCEIAIATFPQNVKVRAKCEKLSNTQMIKGTYAKTKWKSAGNSFKKLARHWTRGLLFGTPLYQRLAHRFSKPIQRFISSHTKQHKLSLLFTTLALFRHASDSSTFPCQSVRW